MMRFLRPPGVPPDSYSLRSGPAWQAGVRVAAPLLALLLLAAGARAQSAREAEYEIPGAEAWAEASRAGFEFYPVIPDDRFILAGARDGAWTTLKTCSSPIEPCEAEAQVADGELVVLGCPDGCDRVHEFRLYAGRPLAPGWRIAAVEMSGSWAWARRPGDDPRDPSFTVRVASRGGRAASAAVRSIRLIGPPGSDWRAAFAAP